MKRFEGFLFPYKIFPYKIAIASYFRSEYYSDIANQLSIFAIVRDASPHDIRMVVVLFAQRIRRFFIWHSLQERTYWATSLYIPGQNACRAHDLKKFYAPRQLVS